MSVVEARLASILGRSWWLLLLRGLAAIAFGLFTWFQPGLSLATLILLFAIYSVADGVFSIWTAIAGRHDHEHWWVLLLAGLLGIVVGVLTFLAPGLTALALLLYIAIWAMGTGLLQVIAAIRLRKEITGEWLLILAGLLSVAFGIMVMARPGVGALAVLSLIAVYAVVYGVLLVVLSFRVRRFGKVLSR